jgi:hypothetical protein
MASSVVSSITGQTIRGECDTPDVKGYDIIGDVHGCDEDLEERLQSMGYRPDATGTYRHPDREAIFAGDLIDRGAGHRRVLHIVKGMVDAGSARIVMGNHEFNAIAWGTEHPERPGEYLRPRNPENQERHAEFLDQLTLDEQNYYREWFKTLPLWLDLGGVRVVHACWHEPSMRVIENELGSNRFSSTDQLVRAATPGTDLYEAIGVLLWGPEIDLAAHGQPPYLDDDGRLRYDARVRWWLQNATTLRDLAVVDGYTTEDGLPYPIPPARPVDMRELSYVYTSEVPVLYGHYWRRDNPEHLLDWTERTACVDFSAVSGGTLVAYRWSGEATIYPRNYVPNGEDAVFLDPAD